MRSRFVCLILLAMLTGCNRDRQHAPTAHAATSAALPSATALPATKRDSIRLEGSWQPLLLGLFQPGGDLPFYTYVPSDMLTETHTSAHGVAYRFIANFAGTRKDDAYLEVFVFPAAMNKDSIVATAKRYRDAHKQKGFSNAFDLRMHNNRYYYIARFYPEEYGDGFAPRAQRILDEWQWLDATSLPRP